MEQQAEHLVKSVISGLIVDKHIEQVAMQWTYCSLRGMSQHSKMSHSFVVYSSLSYSPHCSQKTLRRHIQTSESHKTYRSKLRHFQMANLRMKRLYLVLKFPMLCHDITCFRQELSCCAGAKSNLKHSNTPMLRNEYQNTSRKRDANFLNTRKKATTHGTRSL